MSAHKRSQLDIYGQFETWEGSPSSYRGRQADRPRERACGSRRTWDEDKGRSEIVAAIMYLGETLDEASTQYLLNNKAPSRKCGERDNRGTHFYLALYWAQALAAQDADLELKTEFAPLAEQLGAAEEQIMAELDSVQGQAVELGGYYQPDENALQPYRNLLFKRLDAIYDKVSEQPGFSVWIVEGISGALWLDWIKQNASAAPDAVILVDVYIPQLRLNELLSTEIAKLPFPVLDIKTASANRWVTAQWPMHKTMSNKYQQLSYRPRVLLTQVPEATHELHSVIKGWLKFQGF